MLTYILFKTQSTLLSATSRKGQTDADSHSVQNAEHALVSNKQEGPATCWLACCSKCRACCCQQWAGRASHMLTYKLLKTQASSCQQQAGRASHMLTYKLFKTHSMLLSATSWKGQPHADLHSVEHSLHAFVSNKQEGPATCWLTSCWRPSTCSCQQQAGRASQMLTYILFKTQSMLLSATIRATQMLTYILFKTQSMLLSATSRKGQPHADLHAVQDP